MNKHIKKLVLGVLVGTMAVGSLAGCSKKVDGTQTVATVNDDKISLGTMSFMMRYQQAQTMQMYASLLGQSADSFWDQEDSESEDGGTYGDSTRQSVLEQLETMMLLKQHAGDYSIEITEDEKNTIEEAAQSFIDSNGEDVLNAIGASKDDIVQALELSTYQSKMYDPVTADVDTNITDEEAAQTGITYVQVDVSAEGEEATDEETQTAKDTAQQVLDLAVADPTADFNELATQVDENLTATTTTFTTAGSDSETVPDALISAVSGLSDGTVVPNLVEGDGCFYVERLDSNFDQQATEDKKTTILNDRKTELYQTTTDGWKEDSTIDEDKKVLKKVTLDSKTSFSFKTEDTTTDTGTTSDALTDAAEDSSSAE